MSNLKDLMSSEQNKYLQELRYEVGGARIPLYPKIAMMNDKSDIKGMQKGEYYISDSIKEKDGSSRTVQDSIGSSPEVILLRRRYSYSCYSKTLNKLIAWTSELDDFHQKIILINNNNPNKAPFLEFTGSYQEFKTYKERKYVDIEGRNLLKLRNVFYLLFNGEIYRMFVSNASITGVPKNEKHGDYNNPQEGAFVLWEKTLQAASVHFAERILRLGAKQKEGDSYYLMTFEDAGENPNIMEAIEMRKKLDDDLQKRFMQEYGSLLVEKTTSREENLPDFDSENLPEFDSDILDT